MALSGSLIFNTTLATGANADSSDVNIAGAASVMLFITSDKALTVVAKVSPLSSLMDATPPAAGDFYPLGNSIAVAANTPMAQQLSVGGAATLRLNFANASGTTATIKAYARPSVSQIGR